MMLTQISLNLSFVLYCILYIPQLMHNQKKPILTDLSLVMHLFLYCAYCFDLLYSTLTHLPWQYRLAAGLGWLYLSLQQLQFIRYYHLARVYSRLAICFSVWIGSVLLSIYVLYVNPSQNLATALGYVAQIAFCTALLPQVIKSRKIQSSAAISLIDIALNCFVSCLDLICAWQLNWGWPNRLGSILIVCLTGLLLLQSKRYRYAES